MTHPDPDEPTLEMPAPVPGKHPMKENFFFVARAAASQLNPLFPFAEAGTLVPCTASFRSGPGAPAIGHFLHVNHVDEVAVVYGSTGDMRTGDVFVGAKKHGVGGWGGGDRPFFAAMTITQRQVESGPQPETASFSCEQCNTVLVSKDYDGQPQETAHYPPLPTTDGTYQAAAAFNRSEESRTCPSCGHVNRPFPIHIWGWDRYMFNTGVVNEARAVLEEATQ